MDILVLMSIIILFLFGLAIGSFINALEYRLKNKLDFVKKRSHCPKCKHTLAWFDLIPLLSFLILRGKCRYCKAKISWQDPIVEFISGVIFSLAGFYVSDTLGQAFIFGNLTGLVTYFLLAFLVGLILTFFLFIAVYDLKYQIILNQVIVPSILIVFVLDLFLFVCQQMDLFPSVLSLFYEFNLLYYLISSIGAAIFILFLIIITKGEGMGGGDLRLVILMGLILGPWKFLIAFYIALITGSVVGIFWGIKKGKLLGLKVPFGTFLALGSVIAMVWGGEIIEIVRRYLYI